MAATGVGSLESSAARRPAHAGLLSSPQTDQEPWTLQNPDNHDAKQGGSFRDLEGDFSVFDPLPLLLEQPSGILHEVTERDRLGHLPGKPGRNQG